MVASGGESVAVVGWGRLAAHIVALGAGVGAPPEQRALDGFLEGAFGDGRGSHGVCLVEGGGVGCRGGVVAHVDLAGDGGGDQGGAVLVEEVDGLGDLGGQGVDLGCLAVEVVGDGLLFGEGGDDYRKILQHGKSQRVNRRLRRTPQGLKP